MFEMVSGQRAFEEGNEYETYVKIKEANFHLPNHFSPPLKKLLSSILLVDPLKRIKMEDLFKHAWMDKVFKKKTGFSEGI